jgi:hypothetical protein
LMQVPVHFPVPVEAEVDRHPHRECKIAYHAQ